MSITTKIHAIISQIDKLVTRIYVIIHLNCMIGVYIVCTVITLSSMLTPFLFLSVRLYTGSNSFLPGSPLFFTNIGALNKECYPPW